jgi:hypothetical protein
MVAWVGVRLDIPPRSRRSMKTAFIDTANTQEPIWRSEVYNDIILVFIDVLQRAL